MWHHVIMVPPHQHALPLIVQLAVFLCISRSGQKKQTQTKIGKICEEVWENVFSSQSVKMWCVTRENNLGWQCQCCSLSTLPGNVPANWWYLFHSGMSAYLLLPNQSPRPVSKDQLDLFKVLIWLQHCKGLLSDHNRASKWSPLLEETFNLALGNFISKICMYFHFFKSYNPWLALVLSSDEFFLKLYLPTCMSIPNVYIYWELVHLAVQW